MDLDADDGTTDYDHATDLLDCVELQPLASGDELIALELDSAQIAHTLLADRERALALQAKYRAPDLLPSISAEIGERPAPDKIDVRIFYSSYLVN